MQSTKANHRIVAKGAMLILGLLLCWIYLAVFLSLIHCWNTQSQYSHGYLVPLFSAYLLWSRRRQLDRDSQPSWSGHLLLIAGLALLFVGNFFYFEWFSQISLIPTLLGVAAVSGGWRAFRWSWPAIAFLIFMIPLPFRLETVLAYPLQRIATMTSTFTLQTLGFVAFADGNVIHLGEHRIGIVEACNGLSMLVVFFALSTAILFVVKLTLLEKVIVFLSAIPIAVIANVTRIVVTAVLYKVTTGDVAQLFFHDLAGWLMMVFALGLLWLELKLFSWLFVPVPPDEDLMAASFAGLHQPAANGAPATHSSTLTKAQPSTSDAS